MNVLLTSVGRRAYLVRYFKEALSGKGQVFAINSEAQAAGMYEADMCFVAPRVDSATYIDFVCDVITKHDIKLVLSLFDIDLPYLSEYKAKIESLGAKLVVSDPAVIAISNDKWLTAKFCKENNLLFPVSYIDLEEAEKGLAKGLLSFPLVIKPRWGMGSLSVLKANDLDELRFYYAVIKKQIMASYLNILSAREIDETVLIQACISGQEYGLDIFNDLNGNYIQTVVKKKIAMRSGETDMAEVFSDHSLEILGQEIAGKLKHVGNLDVDIMLTEDNQPFVIEFNARFGGGYPFSHLAGASFPEKLIQMAESPSSVIAASKIKQIVSYKDIEPKVAK